MRSAAAAVGMVVKPVEKRLPFLFGQSSKRTVVFPLQNLTIPVQLFTTGIAW